MIIRADARAIPLAAGCVDCVVTSPPYWGLRSYGHDAQLGLEPTPDAYVAALVAVFRDVARVLKPGGTVWCNLGDSYAGNANSGGINRNDGGPAVRVIGLAPKRGDWLKSKDLVGIPWRVAFALQADGWYLRSDIIWHKPNPMPESVTDRPTKAHEYVFLLTRSARYFYDADAIREPQETADRSKFLTGEEPSGRYPKRYGLDGTQGALRGKHPERLLNPDGRNKRSVWTIATMPYSGFTPNYDEADYVGPDGKPYKASGDCLVHAPLAGRRSQQKAAGGEQLDRTTLRSLDSDARRVSRLIVEHASNVSRRSEPSISESVLGRSLESTGDYRTHSEPMPGDGLGGDDAARYRTNRTEVQSTLLADSPDCLSLGNAVPAMSHSNGNRKTGRALVTTAPYSPCEQTSIGIDDTSASRGSDSVGHTDANKSVEDFVLGGPVTVTERNQPRTARSDSPSCKCSIVGTDHFATMPEALVEPCILAGCPLGGLVLDPFLGSGTVGAVAERLGRRWVGTDLSYQPLAQERTAQRGIPWEVA